MATYNTLIAQTRCPRCGKLGDVEISCYFGETAQMLCLRVGDMYPLHRGAETRHVGRGLAYASECENCGLDWFVRVHLEEGLVAGVAHDPTWLPHLADGHLKPGAPCVECGTTAAAVRLRGGWRRRQYILGERYLGEGALRLDERVVWHHTDAICASEHVTPVRVLIDRGVLAEVAQSSFPLNVPGRAYIEDAR